MFLRIHNIKIKETHLLLCPYSTLYNLMSEKTTTIVMSPLITSSGSRNGRLNLIEDSPSSRWLQDDRNL